jgi:hypothetical protein
MVLCGTKLDLEANREVRIDQPIRLSRRFDCSFLEVSCKELVGVKKLFQTLIRDLQRIESQNDPTKMSENKKKKNMLEWFLPRRPSQQELLEKRIIPSLTEFDFPSFGTEPQAQAPIGEEQPIRKRSQTLSSLITSGIKSIRKTPSKKEERPSLDTMFIQEESDTTPSKPPPFLKVRSNTEDVLERKRNRFVLLLFCVAHRYVVELPAHQLHIRVSEIQWNCHKILPLDL